MVGDQPTRNYLPNDVQNDFDRGRKEKGETWNKIGNRSLFHYLTGKDVDHSVWVERTVEEPGGESLGAIGATSFVSNAKRRKRKKQI